MRFSDAIFLPLIAVLLVNTNVHGEERAERPDLWRVHDMDRPLPPRIESASDRKAPSDAIILFDGKDLSQWRDAQGNAPKWKVRDGYFEIVPGTGDIYTKKDFGDFQLHVEWATPVNSKDPHDAGNSGIMIMGLYEIQVFDSWTTKLYADGGAGAVYGQHPPQVNATLKPGQWQSFDIIWHCPQFNEDGRLKEAATVTVIHNGALVQDHVALWGPIRWMSRASYSGPHNDKLPLSLQDHRNPVRYRNVWIRELPQGPQGAPPPKPKEIQLADSVLKTYVGQYGKGLCPTVALHGQRLRIRVGSLPWFDVIATTEATFVGTDVGVEFKFDRDAQGKVKGVWWYHSGIRAYFPKTGVPGQ